MATKAKKKANPTAKSLIRSLRSEIRVYRAELKESLDHIAKMERLATLDAYALREARRRTIPMFGIEGTTVNFLPACITKIVKDNELKEAVSSSGDVSVFIGKTTVMIECDGEIVISK